MNLELAIPKTTPAKFSKVALVKESKTQPQE